MAVLCFQEARSTFISKDKEPNPPWNVKSLGLGVGCLWGNALKALDIAGLGSTSVESDYGGLSLTRLMLAA